MVSVPACDGVQQREARCNWQGMLGLKEAFLVLTQKRLLSPGCSGSSRDRGDLDSGFRLLVGSDLGNCFPQTETITGLEGRANEE